MVYLEGGVGDSTIGDGQQPLKIEATSTSPNTLNPISEDPSAVTVTDRGTMNVLSPRPEADGRPN